jgi:hypothetical protein
MLLRVICGRKHCPFVWVAGCAQGSTDARGGDGGRARWGGRTRAVGRADACGGAGGRARRFRLRV